MLTRRTFLTSTTLAAALPARAAVEARGRSAELLIQRTVKPVVISDYSGFEFMNCGPENCVSARLPAHHRGQGRARRAHRRRQHPGAGSDRDGHRLRLAAQCRRRHRARRVVHARAVEAGRRGGRPPGRADAVAGRPGGDGLHRPPPAGRRGRAAVRAQHGLQDRRRPQHRELAPAVAGVEAARRPGALPGSQGRRTEAVRGTRRTPGSRPGCRWCATGSSPKAASGAPSTATASAPTATSAA